MSVVFGLSLEPECFSPFYCTKTGKLKKKKIVLSRIVGDIHYLSPLCDLGFDCIWDHCI